MYTENLENSKNCQDNLEQKFQPPWLADEEKFGYSSPLKSEIWTKI